MVSDIKSNEKSMNFFCPFPCTYRRCSWRYELGNNWYKCNNDLKEKYINFGNFVYIPIILTRTLSQQFVHTLKMVSLFGITYLCEQLFPRMKNVISKTKTPISDTHLENSLRITTCQITANIEKLVKNKHCQIYNCKGNAYKISKKC